MKKLSLVACLLSALAALTLMFWTPGAHASSSYYTSNCQACHGATSTCNGCHAHGTHASSAKSNINITGTTNKTAYAPGETVSVVITGGYRSGWIRAILYDQNMNELARSTGPTGEGGGAGYPITLTAPAPTAAGTYTWNVSWYGNQYDAGSAFFGPRWTPDPNNPNHGQEIVSTNPFTVAGAVPAPTINLNPASLGFGTITVGSSVTLNTLVQNTGNADLIVSGIGLCAGTSAEFSSSTAVPVTIPAGGSATLSVIYSPVNAGTDTGCLNVASNDTATPTATLNVTGTGAPVPQPTINLSPASLNFGMVTVGGSGTQTAQIQNLGNADLVVSSIGLCAGTSAEFSSSTAVPVTIPAGGSATLSVIYSPVNAGTDTGCLNVASNDTATPTATLNVTGTGAPVPQPTINLSPASLNFGTITVVSSVTLNALVQNTGNADLIVSGIGLCAGTSAEFSSSTVVPVTIPAGGSATLSVIYSPVNAGTDTGCLNVASNDTATPTATLNVTGSGAPVPQPKINLSPASLNFGTVTVGSSGTLNTLVQNTGNADLIVSGIGLCAGTSAEFSSSTAVPVTIPAGGSATLSVIYSPADAGTDTGCLSVASNDSAAPTAALNVSGAGSSPVLPPTINLSPASLNFGTVTVGGSATKTAMIQNLGGSELIISSIGLCAGTSAEFSSSTAVPITIPAGGSATLSVIYSPADAGTDTGCLNVASNDPATPTGVLNVTGTGSVPTAGADLDILKFGASREIKFSREMEGAVRFRIEVINKGTVDGSASATLVGVQGGVGVYDQTITVSAPAGGRAKPSFPSYRPTAPGVIRWTVTIDDPTPDTATATTTVEREGYSGTYTREEDDD